MKRRIAIIIPGGLGVGHCNQGIPVLEALIERLALHFDLTVFPLGKVNAEYRPKGFRLTALHENYDRPIAIRMVKTMRLIGINHRQKKFDILHGIWTFPSGFVAVLLAKWMGTKSVVSLQGGDLARVASIRYGGRMNRIRRRLIQWSLANAGVLTAESRFQKGMVPDPDLIQRIRVIPYGVDTGLFAFRLKPLDHPVRFIHVANLNPVKDQVTLLKAFRLIRDRINGFLTIIGPDYLNGKIQGLARELALEDCLTFKGFIPHKDLPNYLRDAHIMLHTSLHEGMPVVAVEAMASGVVVCGTAVGILADLSPEICITAPVQKHEELAEEVLQLVEDPERYKALQLRGRDWAQQHTIDWTTQQFMEVYNIANE